MQNVMNFLIIIIFIILLYNFSLYYYDTHRSLPKKFYISIKNNIDSFTIGGKPKISCKNKPCKNDGECIPDEIYGYSCNCKSGYSGDNCEFKDDKSKGVGVKLKENIELLKPIQNSKIVSMFKRDKNQWNDYI